MLPLRDAMLIFRSAAPLDFDAAFSRRATVAARYVDVGARVMR